MKQYFLSYNQIDYSRFELFGEEVIERKIILLDSIDEDSAKGEAKDKFSEALMISRAKCNDYLKKKIRLKIPYHEWKPANPSLLMKMAL